MPLTAKTGQKKEPHKWLSFYQLVAFRQLFLSFFNLPLQNLLEVVCFRVCDTHCLYCLVVILSHVVSDVLVVVLSCTRVDVNDSWRNLAGYRILEVCKVER